MQKKKACYEHTASRPQPSSNQMRKFMCVCMCVRVRTHVSSELPLNLPLGPTWVTSLELPIQILSLLPPPESLTPLAGLVLSGRESGGCQSFRGIRRSQAQLLSATTWGQGLPGNRGQSCLAQHWPHHDHPSHGAGTTELRPFLRGREQRTPENSSNEV